jgi:hypothetical protein
MSHRHHHHSTPDGLIQTWFHSHEEDTGNQQVYRPSSYDFPPSRGRYGFQLNQDGTYTDFGIAPTDGTVAQPGNWTFADNTLTLTPASGQAHTFNVVSIAPDQLVLTPK